MNPIPVTIISHADCLDGCAAAWVVKHFLELQTRNHGVVFDLVVHFASYTAPLPAPRPHDNVIFTDFCPDDLLALDAYMKVVDRLTVIDHHPKVESTLVTLHGWASEAAADPQGPAMAKVNSLFSKEASGALLAWHYFAHPSSWRHSLPRLPWDDGSTASLTALPETPLKVIEIVSDGDLYQFKLPETKAIQTALYLRGLTLEGFDACTKLSIAELYHMGKVLLEAKNQAVEWAVSHCRVEVDISSLEGATVALAVNGNARVASDAGHLLEQRYPGYYAYLIYWDGTDGLRHYSVRSQQGHARTLAEHFGGGGHANASGFVRDLEHPLLTIPLKPAA